ncbi:MAG: glycosyltransferase [Verrucomicrobia bacterium]|nr:MAG: glycosyltransferase [Verrucomicrobiota bacterium]
MPHSKRWRYTNRWAGIPTVKFCALISDNQLLWMKRLLPLLGWVMPAVLCAAMLSVVWFAQWLRGNISLPFGLRLLVFLLWTVVIVSYAFQLNLFKRIGGLMVAMLACLIVLFVLLPSQRGRAYSQAASRVVLETAEAAWSVLHPREAIKNLKLEEALADCDRSLARSDAYRRAQVGLFLLLGLALSICFLFPVDPLPFYAYFRRWLLLFFFGTLFSLQAELLHALTPARNVTVSGAISGVLGLLAGLFLFSGVHALWFARLLRHPRTSFRFNVLGVGVDAVNMQDCLALFERFIREGARPVMSTALGVAGIMAARRDQRVQRILNESVLNMPDGMPLVWLGRLLGYRNIERVYGPDILREVCAYSAGRGWRHFFYGAAPGVAELLKTRMEALYPNIKIVGTECPPYRALRPEEEEKLVEKIRLARPDIFWIGISTPRQLMLMDTLKDKLACKIICPVGYAFDVNAGVEQDAPEWIKVAGVQWLHRALKQPRLWKRYLPDNPSFVIQVFAQLLRLKKYPMYVHEQPRTCFRDAEGFPRFPAGVVSLSALSLREARDRVARWIETRQRHYVNICTADTIVQCADQPPLAKIVCEAGMATTDGMPLVWLAKHYGFHAATRVYGPDLMLELCALSEDRGYTHYFYGATDEVLVKLKARLLQQFPRLKIVGMYAPPFRPLTPEEDADVAKQINAVHPDVVWCGLGTPKQDYWVHYSRSRLEAAALIAAGAAFNFHAGYVRQAPRWMMCCGLEWFFRLCMEPRRLWRRYLVGNPRFLYLLWKHRGRNKS